jgi:hypothetical protein
MPTYADACSCTSTAHAGSRRVLLALLEKGVVFQEVTDAGAEETAAAAAVPVPELVLGDTVVLLSLLFSLLALLVQKYKY